MPVVSDIETAIETAVTGIVTGATIKKRKVPTVAQGESVPLVVIWVGEEGEVEPLTGVQDALRYPAAVTVVTAGGAKLADDSTLRGYRDSIRAAVNKGTAFTGVTGFERVEVAGRAPFHPAALPKDFNYSTQVFTVEVTETRAR